MIDVAMDLQKPSVQYRECGGLELKLLMFSLITMRAMENGEMYKKKIN